MDRSADVDGLVTKMPRFGFGQAKLFEHIIDAERVDGAVDNYTQGAILVVLTDQGYGARKIGVLELGHGNQELIAETLKGGGAHRLVDCNCFTG